MRKARRGWTMPEEDARSMLVLIEERIRASDIRFEHRDVLIRLRAMIEDDLSDVSGPPVRHGAKDGGEQTALGLDFNFDIRASHLVG